MKRLIGYILLLVVCCVFEKVDVMAEDFSDYTPISTKEELNAIRNNLDGKYYLVNDIEFESTDFEIGGAFYNSGSKWKSIGQFKGVLDGNGYTIKNLQMFRETVYNGFCSMNEGEIRNLTFENTSLSYKITVDGTGSLVVYTGIIAGSNEGIIENITVRDSSLSVTVTYESKMYSSTVCTGIVTGVNSNEIRKCKSENNTINSVMMARGELSCGGIIGRNLGTVEECYNVNGTVSANVARTPGTAMVGGIIGEQSKGAVDKCYNQSVIESKTMPGSNDANAGGIVGVASYSNNIISNCFNVGTLNSSSETKKGSIVGVCSSNPDVYNCYYLVDVCSMAYGEDSDGEVVESVSGFDKVDMSNSDSYENFDFHTDWVIDVDSGVLYPQLAHMREVNVATINIKKLPKKVEYLQGEEFYVDGGELEVSYIENSNIGTIKMQEYMISDVDMTKSGKQEVNVSYAGLSSKFEIEIITLEPATSVSIGKSELKLELNSTYLFEPVILPSTSNDICMWSSSDESIVDIDEEGVATALKLGSATITATTLSGMVATCTIDVVISATDILLDKQEIELLQERDISVVATLEPATSTDQILWESLDENIAVVDQNGKITAMNPGITDVTATTSSGVSKKIKVNVLPAYHVATIEFEEDIIKLEKGDMKEINISITPSNYTDTVTIVSEDENIVRIEDGKMIANSVGETYIVAESENGISSRVKVIVSISATDITLDKSTLTITKGKKIGLVATLVPNDSSDLIFWSSSDESVATVSNDGYVTSIALGTCDVIAKTLSGKQCVCKVNVIEENIINDESELVNILNTGGTIKCILNEDISVSATDGLLIKSGSEVSLDLNGHTITGLGQSVITNNGILNVKDSVGSGLIRLSGTKSFKNYAGISNNAGAILVIESGTIQVQYSCSSSLNIAIVSGIYNYGAVNYNGGDIIVSSSIDADTATQQIYGIFNNDNGILSMSGGNIKLSTKADATSTDAEIRTTTYGVANQTNYQMKMTGGMIEVKHDITSNAKENWTFISGIANNSSDGSISVKDGTIKSQMVGDANNVSGGLTGICNLASGNIYFDGGNVDVLSDINKELLVGGIVNYSSGSIIVGNESNASNVNPSISTESKTQLDTAIEAGEGLLAIRHGKIRGTIGIHSKKDVIIGTNNDVIKSDDLYIEGSSYIFLLQGKFNLYDGTFSGGLNLDSQGDLIYLPKGYILDGIKDNRLTNGTLKPIKYIITYNLYGGKNNSNNPDTYDITSEKFVLCVPSREGYRFVGWYTDSQYRNKIESITGDLCQNIVLYAKWEEVIKEDEEKDVEIGTTINASQYNCEVQVTSKDDAIPTVAYVRLINGSSKTIKVPKVVTIDGIQYKVTSIANDAFKNNSTVTKIIIGDNVKTVGKNAFSGCKNLKSVTMGKNVTTIGSKAFYNCKSLTKITIPSKVTKIDSYAFKNCKKLSSVTIGKSVKTIGKEAFRECSKLKNIIIKSKKLKTVGKNAFKGIKSSAKIKVPSSKLKPYKKLLKNKGQGKKVRITK